MSKLLSCYNNLKDILGPNYKEPYEVVEHVNKLKNFWKPKKVKVILLAESHVYTNKEDFSVSLDLTKIPLKNYPNKFVRYVYCLGYGENELLQGSVDKNRGTPPFWKIFYSCVNNFYGEPGFNPILKTKNKILEERIKAKILILKKLKERGIWLLDSSIAGLYIPGEKKPSLKAQRKVLTYCWENLIREEAERADPKRLIIIGKGVGRILENEMTSDQRKISTILNQPQARLNSNEQMELFLSCSRICNKPI